MKFQQEYILTTDLAPGSVEHHWRILADGKPTGITRYYCIGGEYKDRVNELRFEGENFDMTNINADGYEEWIKDRMASRNDVKIPLD